MIIEELVLHNFGPFKDEQRLELAPTAKRKPVILIGALNGSGKTTLLDAIHLALYGRRAKCHNRGNQAYEAYLRNCIHRHSPPEEGAGLELQFKHRVEGEDHTYRVMRWWKANGKGTEEHFEVVRDSNLDTVITEAWDEHVEGFMPQGIAPLFFFDGEKVEDLADLEKSGPLISTALNSLLGIDLIQQLSRDLVVLDRRTRKSSQPAADQGEIDKLEFAVGQARSAVLGARQKLAAANNEVATKRNAFDKVNTRFKSEGGELFEHRAELEASRKALDKTIQEAEDRLREIAEGAAPLVLLDEQLDAVRKQAQREQKALESQLLGNVLERRDVALLKTAGKVGVAAAKRKKLAAHLEADRKKRLGKAKVEPYLDLSATGFSQLDSIRGEKTKLRAQVRSLLNEVQELQAKCVDADRQLQQVPDHDAIATLIRDRAQAKAEFEAAERQCASLQSDVAAAENVEQERQRALSKALEVKIVGDFRFEDAGRIIEHSARARETLGLFRETLIKMDSERIQDLIGKSFKKLLRKRHLVDKVEIQPPSFEVRLKNRHGQTIPPDRLSAGERQLLAVSILWGLAQASGRTLPAIVDTPLGRLDSAHRIHLVERYFPKASHQVLLLSTDEEINKRYYQDIKKWVGRSYCLEHNDDTEATTVKPGYFWS